MAGYRPSEFKLTSFVETVYRLISSLSTNTIRTRVTIRIREVPKKRRVILTDGTGNIRRRCECGRWNLANRFVCDENGSHQKTKDCQTAQHETCNEVHLFSPFFKHCQHSFGPAFVTRRRWVCNLQSTGAFLCLVLLTASETIHAWLSTDWIVWPTYLFVGVQIFNYYPYPI